MAAITSQGVYLDFIRLIVSGNVDHLTAQLAANPALATTAAAAGATRQDASNFFFADIAHYLFAGDTALHLAAAAFRRPVAELLIAHGANCRARNRRGAEPLHYASDTNHWNPEAQADVIACLIAAGADPNASDDAGVAPIHRAVRTRSLPAVMALVDGGARPTQRNGSGSTPLHLAVQGTGRSGSGAALAREQQAGIIALLLQRGAQPSDVDGQGRTAYQAATSAWIRALLDTALA